MEETFCCCGCGRLKLKSPRHKNQNYCGMPACQQARKRQWEREKQKNDPDYRFNRKAGYHRRHQKNRDYWTKRRQSKNPMERTTKNQESEPKIPPFEPVFAQTDASESSNDQRLQGLPSSQSAQTDASFIERIIISNGCLVIPLEAIFAQTDASKFFSSVFSSS